MTPPDVLRNQNTSVAKAKQAISSYKKAVGEPAGLAELMVFYCERAAGFCNDLGNQDEVFFDALVRMFEEALKVIGQLPAPDRDALMRGWIAYASPATTSATASETIWTPCSPGTRESDVNPSVHEPSPDTHACRKLTLQILRLMKLRKD